MPCSILVAIISTEMMASSTSRPSEMIKAPSEMRCRSMPESFIIRKVTASTRGMDNATTRPVRKPRLKKLTASTMTTASSSVCMNSSTERFTTSGWFEYWCTSMPTGRSRLTLLNAFSRSSPSCRMSPPLAIDTASATASCPM